MKAILPILVVVVIALASGAGYSLMIDRSSRSTTAEQSAAVAPSKNLPELAREVVVALEPILVSSEGRKQHWLRLEGAISFKQSPGKDELQLLLKNIAEDMLTYLRSTPLEQFESAVGIEFLRDELFEIARMRSKGRASKFILKAMVIE